MTDTVVTTRRAYEIEQDLKKAMDHRPGCLSLAKWMLNRHASGEWWIDSDTLRERAKEAGILRPNVEIGWLKRTGHVEEQSEFGVRLLTGIDWERLEGRL